MAVVRLSEYWAIRVLDVRISEYQDAGHQENRFSGNRKIHKDRRRRTEKIATKSCTRSGELGTEETKKYPGQDDKMGKIIFLSRQKDFGNSQ